MTTPKFLFKQNKKEGNKMKISIGHSEDIDTKDAIKEILAHCEKELNGSIPQAGILYSSIEHDFQILLDEIMATYPDIELIGGSTDGELSSKLGFAEDSITLMLFHSDEIDIKAGFVDDVSENMEEKIEKAINETKSKLKKHLKFCIINAVSFPFSAVVILKHFQKYLGKDFPIFGGTTADQWKMKKTFQFFKNQVRSNAITFLIFSGPIFFGSGIGCGWTPIGNPGKITKVENNIVYEIDNKPALDFFYHYLGKSFNNLVAYPLAVFETENSEEFYLRAPTVENREVGSLIFAGDIPKNSTIQITHTTRERILDGSEKALNQAMNNYNGKKPALAICFSCSARKQVLGTKTNQEYNILNSTKPDLKVFGFYGYGEIAPLKKNTESKFHNETFVCLLVGNK